MPDLGHSTSLAQPSAPRISGPVLTDALLREECVAARRRVRLLITLYADVVHDPGRLAGEATLRREALDLVEELGAGVTAYAELLRQQGWPVEHATSEAEELVRQMPTIADTVQGALREHLLRAARAAYRTPPERARRSAVTETREHSGAEAEAG